VAIGLEDKKAIVAEVQQAASGALSAVVAGASGISVNNMTLLRKEATANGVSIRVVRNTLAKRAVQGTAFECLSDSFVGPSLIAFSTDHPGAGARILKEFAKKHAALEIRAAAFEGTLTDVSLLASLPTYDEAIAKLMSVMKEAAAGKLVRTIAAIRDQKEQSAA
jgi:large subunit ribosomal protein L10